MDNDLMPFVGFLRKQRIAYWISAVVCAAGAVGFFLFAKDPKLSEQTNLLLRVGAAGVLALVAVFAAVMASRPPERNAALRALVARAGDVVWIWPTVHKRNNIHVRTSYGLGLIDGQKPVLNVSPSDEAAAETCLQQRCPSARFGYDPEWEQLFKTNPGALRS